MAIIINPTTALVCLVCLAVTVILLNIFAFVVTFSAGRRKESFNYPLLWLLIANILIGLFPLPVYGLKKYEFTSVTITSTICDIWRYTYFTTINMSMLSLLIMTLEKIAVLVCPLRHSSIVSKTKLNTSFAVSWLFIAVFDLIPFIPFDHHDDDGCHYVIKKDWALAMNIITMAIPLPIIIVCYLYMTYLAYSHSIRINRTISTQTSRSSNIKLMIKVKATKKVTHIVGAYIICWTPSTMYYMLVWLCPEKCFPKNYQPHKTWIRFFFKLLVMCHAFITPILFCWLSSEFRRDVKTFFKNIGRNKCRIPESVDNSVIMSTIASFQTFRNRTLKKAAIQKRRFLSPSRNTDFVSEISDNRIQSCFYKNG